MSDSVQSAGYRSQIVETIRPVRPLPAPVRRASMLVPLGLLLAASPSLISGQRGDLGAYAPLLTWGATGLQSLLGIWVLALGFREAVPGANLSRRALLIAALLSAAVVVGITLLTNGASATVVPLGREWKDWSECVFWPTAVGAPLMVGATLMAARAYPTRPAIAGALCGASAGMLSDAGWRLTCWISQPSHVIGSHGLAIVALTAAGAVLAVWVDAGRWTRLRQRL